MPKTVKYGIVIAGVNIVWILSIYYSHNQFTRVGLYSFLISLLFFFPVLFKAIKDKRDNELNGFMTLNTCMKTGMTVTIVCAMIMAVFYYVYFKFIDHEIIPFYMKEGEMAVKSNPKFKIEDIELAVNSMFSPFKQATVALIRYTIAGALFSFICSTFLVRQPPENLN